MGGSIGDIAKTVGLNVATGGLYSLVQAGVKATTTGKIGASAADAFAGQGLAGNVLQPTVGTKKALLAEGAVAGGALGAAVGGTAATADAAAIPASASTIGLGAAAGGAAALLGSRVTLPGTPKTPGTPSTPTTALTVPTINDADTQARLAFARADALGQGRPPRRSLLGGGQSVLVPPPIQQARTLG